MPVIHRKGKVLFTWIKQELDKRQCFCSVLHIPWHWVFSFLLSSAQDYTLSCRLVSLHSCLFYLDITHIFSSSPYYFCAFFNSVSQKLTWKKKSQKNSSTLDCLSLGSDVYLLEVCYCFRLSGSIGALSCSFLQLF